jgi:GT2 family glycosyltransferase
MNGSSSIDVTIVVVPRERFSLAPQSLRSVLENTEPLYKLIYVDGGSPGWVRRIIESQVRENNFTLIRSDRYLSPNEARNLGFAKVQTKYTLFLDNDVIVAPGWLNGLVRCAEETGAEVVGPLYCIGQPYHQKIHMAGGLAHFEENDGSRRYIDRHLMGHSWLKDVRYQLKREPSERCEFHCMLIRTDAMRTVGPLDEKLLGIVETHADLCLLVRNAGGAVWFEPSSVVTYVPPPPVHPSDLPYFLLRWSGDWTIRGKAHFAEKWGLRADDPDLTRHNWWIYSQRLLFVRPVWTALGVLGMQRRNRVAAGILSALDFLVTRRIARRNRTPKVG